MARVAVAVGGPAGRDTGGEHGRVLARAVHVHPVRAAPLAKEVPHGVLVERQRGGHCSTSSVRPALARILRTPVTWKSSPEWLAAASASSSPSRSSPQPRIAAA